MFLQKYFARNNLVVIYPERFGAAESANVPSAIDPLSSDFMAAPSSLWVRSSLLPSTHSIPQTLPLTASAQLSPYRSFD